MDDREYFRRRAEAERAAAIKAKDNTSCRVHVELAKHYEWRAAMEPRLQGSAASAYSPASARSATRS